MPNHMRHRCAFFTKNKSHRVWLCQQHGVFTLCRIEDSGLQPFFFVWCDLWHSECVWVDFELELLLLLNTVDFVKVYYNNITTSQHIFQLNCQWLVAVFQPFIHYFYLIYVLSFYYLNYGVLLKVNHFNHLTILHHTTTSSI